MVVQGNRVIGQGYNGVPSGETHCIDGGCPRGKFTHAEVPKDTDYNLVPCLALHAEMNAILQAGFLAARGGTIYVTDEPCTQCATLIKHVGIERVVVDEGL